MNICFFKHPPSVEVTIRIIDSYINAFNELGHNTMSIHYDTVLETREQVNAFAAKFMEFKSDFAVCYGFSAMPQINGSYFFRKQGIPLIVLCFDNPFLGLTDDLYNEIKSHPNLYHLFIWDSYYLDLFSRISPNCYPILHAADLNNNDHGTSLNKIERDVAFVGSMTDGTGLRNRRHKVSNPLNDLIDQAILKKLESPDLNTIEIIHSLKRTIGGIDYKNSQFNETRERFHKEVISPIYKEAQGFYRYHILNQLSDFKVHYYGNMKWDAPHILSHPPVEYGVNLSRLYRSTAINLDIPAMQSIFSVNNRVLDVGACEAFLLTEDRSDLSKISKNKEDYTYSSIDELKEKIRFYLDNPEKRKRIAQTLFDSIKSGHTYRHRVKYITDTIC